MDKNAIGAPLKVKPEEITKTLIKTLNKEGIDMMIRLLYIIDRDIHEAKELKEKYLKGEER